MKMFLRIKPSTQLHQELRKDQRLQVALAPHLIFTLNRHKQYVLEDPSDAAILALESLSDVRRNSIEVIGSAKGAPSKAEILHLDEVLNKFSSTLEIEPDILHSAPDVPAEEEPIVAQTEPEEEPIVAQTEPVIKKRGRTARKEV